METTQAETAPQRAEGITACRWVAYGEATAAISYGNARQVLFHAFEMISGERAPAPSIPAEPPADQLGLAFEGHSDSAQEEG
jgi:hypothetical protein